MISVKIDFEANDMEDALKDLNKIVELIKNGNHSGNGFEVW